MHSDRINIFHITNCNTVSGCVSHHFIFNLFPTCDTALYKHLSHTGKTKSIFQDFHKLTSVVSNSTTTSAKSVCRAKNDRISNLFCKFNSVLYGLNNERCRTRLSYFFHRRLKFKTIFRFLDCLSSRTDQTYIVLFEKSALFKLHGKIQCCLSSQSRQDTVWLLFHNKLLDNFYRQWLYVYFISNILICHDSRRIRV